MAKTKQSPGSLLLGLLDKHGLNCNRLAREIKCSQTALRLISLDQSRITTSVAMRLAKVFSTNPEFWLVAQMKYDIDQAAGDKKLNKILKGISKAGKKR
ncbi:MAG: HigA family addiction module antitoxin [Treponema sp.]|nr:HigA family addiction module antitoxin [Treponema sp.]